MGSGTAVHNGPVQWRRTGTPKATCRMVGDAGSIRAVRAVVHDLMAGEPAEVRDAAVLLTNELVTNALVHGDGRFSLEIDRGRDAIVVAVSDRNPDVPRVLHPSGDREHGRGMAIVDSLADAWGTDWQPTYKVVWFELLMAG